ncbi:MAG: hypothetical protein R2856_39580 [Caldilineaceae bacterium]
MNYTVGGTAVAEDYTPVLSGSITIDAGQALPKSALLRWTMTLMIPTETVILTLSADAAYLVGSPNGLHHHRR